MSYGYPQQQQDNRSQAYVQYDYPPQADNYPYGNNQQHEQQQHQHAAYGYPSASQAPTYGYGQPEIATSSGMPPPPPPQHNYQQHYQHSSAPPQSGFQPVYAAEQQQTSHLPGPQYTNPNPTTSSPSSAASRFGAIPDVPRFDMRAHAKSLPFSDEEISTAIQEHFKVQTDMHASPDEIKDMYGAGIFYYFQFIKFVIAANMIFALLQGIGYIIYVTGDDPSFESETTATWGKRMWYHDFFITKYSTGQALQWKTINSVCIIFCFLSGPFYYKLMDRWYKETSLSKGDVSDDRVLRYNNDGTLDVSSFYRTYGDLFLRRMVSVFVFCGFIVIQVLFSWLLTKNEGNGTNLALALGIAIIVAILNLSFQWISQLLTETEKWATYTIWKRSHTLKLIFFKLGNIVTVYAAKDYNASSNVTCIYDIIGEQFLMILFVEIVLMNIWEIFSTIAKKKNMHRYARWTGSINGDQDNLPPFDIAMEYLEILYRQYIAVMAMTVFPLSMIISTVGLVVEVYVDKFRLFKICGRPKKMARSQKGFVAIVLFGVTIASLVTPYAGSALVLSGWTGDRSKLCRFPS